MSHTPNLCRPRFAALLGLALAACGSDPVLQSVAIDARTGRVFVAVGETRQLTLMGTYSDGKTSPLTTDVSWASSEPAVASMEQTGLVVPWARGTAQITATHRGSGLEATAALTSRVVTTVAAGTALPFAGTVDGSTAYFRVVGLAPGAMYTPRLAQMSDDVDLSVYTDLSLETRLCDSDYIGTLDDSCVAPATGSGELWVVADGQWTAAGATFALDVPAAPQVWLAGTLAYPSAFPYSGSVDATRRYYQVTELTPNAEYEVRISQLTADVDLGVYVDPYRYTMLCESYAVGTADDSCVARADPTGALILEIDGETSPRGGSYSLTLTPTATAP